MPPATKDSELKFIQPTLSLISIETTNRGRNNLAGKRETIQANSTERVQLNSSVHFHGSDYN